MARELGNLLAHQPGESTAQARHRLLGIDDAAPCEVALIDAVLRQQRAQCCLIARPRGLPAGGGVFAACDDAPVSAADADHAGRDAAAAERAILEPERPRAAG